jgi:hypothetical protein
MWEFEAVKGDPYNGYDGYVKAYDGDTGNALIFHCPIYDGYVIEAYDGDTTALDPLDLDPLVLDPLVLFPKPPEKKRWRWTINTQSLTSAGYEICDLLKDVQRQSDSDTNLMQMIFNATIINYYLHLHQYEFPLNNATFKILEHRKLYNPSLYDNPHDTIDISKGGIPRIRLWESAMQEGEVLNNVFNSLASRIQLSWEVQTAEGKLDADSRDPIVQDILNRYFWTRLISYPFDDGEIDEG